MKMTREDFVPAYFDRFLSKGDDSVVRAQAGARFEFQPSAVQGAAGDIEHVVHGMTRARAAFPDLQVNVEQVFGDERFIAATWRMAGTHTGADFRGVPATGRRFDIRGAHHFEFDGEDLVGLRDYLPLAAILDQLGIFSTSSPEGAPRA